MNKSVLRIISLCLLVSVLACAFVGCASSDGGTPTTTAPADNTPVVEKDWATEVKLDMTSSSKKVNATVYNYVDGDTTWFTVDDKSLGDNGVVKARYLAVNTPESTAKIEEWGKTASNFTKEKLQSATAIVLESDDSEWHIDSTGTRYLLWVWYKTADSDEYRNLNIELLQNGLALASNSASSRYGSYCMSAIDQARALKMHMYSGQKDPNFYYGDAVELSLKELRMNVAEYNGKTVAFEGVVALNGGNSGVYVESYDEETQMYYGMYVYYGYSTGQVVENLAVGNKVRVVGTCTQYNGSYQVSDVSYKVMKPNDPGNTQALGSGFEAAYLPTTAATFHSKVTISVETEDAIEEKQFDYAELALGTSISMENLTVKSIYTTTAEESSSKGAMTITCTAEDGSEVAVRTAVLKDENGKLLTAADFEGKVISIKGIVDFYENSYQIKVFSVGAIEFVG